MKQYKDTPYFVDTEGNVYRNGIKVKTWVNDNGYCLMSFPGKKMIRVHRLVAETYIPNPENKPQVNHINGIRTDNRVENLEWATALENNLHKINILGTGRGDRLKRNKLTEEQVLEIRQKYSTGNYTQTDLGKEYGVYQTTISDIVNNRMWKYL